MPSHECVLRVSFGTQNDGGDGGPLHEDCHPTGAVWTDRRGSSSLAEGLTQPTGEMLWLVSRDGTQRGLAALELNPHVRNALGRGSEERRFESWRRRGTRK